jgi:hypothetical protein
MSLTYKDYLIDLENKKREDKSVKCEHCNKYYLDIKRHNETKKCKRIKLELEKWNTNK